MNKRFLFAVTTLALVGACSHKTPQDKTGSVATGPSIEAKQVAMEEEASFVTEFGFKKGSAALTPAAKAELSKLMKDARATGEIKEVKVITWGDVEYPSVHTKKLSSREIDLVDKRNEAIRDYVKSINDVNVDSHSMAKRPGVVKEMFNTTDARLKRSLEVAGVPNTDTSSKTPSKASRAIVMVIRE